MRKRDDPLLSEFLAKCREQLAGIDHDLLAIEEGGAGIDEPLVDKVFRAAHSIKGGAGFFNLGKIRELGHRTENVLEMVRSREMIPTPEVVNILLLAFARLRELVDRHPDGDGEDESEIVAALSGLASSFLPTDEKDSVGQDVELDLPDLAVPIKISEFSLLRARREGCYLYLLQIDLIHDVQRRGKTPLDVMKALLDSGSFLDAQIDLASAGTLEAAPTNELLLRLLYASVVDPPIMAALAEIPAERIRVLETPAGTSSWEEQFIGIAPAAYRDPAGITISTDPWAYPEEVRTAPATTPPAVAIGPFITIHKSPQLAALRAAARPASTAALPRRAA